MILASALVLLLAQNSDANSVKFVSLSPNITDVIAHLIPEDKLIDWVGVSSGNRPSPLLDKIDIISNAFKISEEALYKANPDIIFYDVSVSAAILNLKSSRLRSKLIGLDFSSVPKSILSTQTIIQRLGIIKNKSKVNSALMKITQLRKIISNLVNKKIYCIISEQPLRIAGKKSFLENYISVIGLNLDYPAESEDSYPQVSKEWLMSDLNKLSCKDVFKINKDFTLPNLNWFLRLRFNKE